MAIDPELLAIFVCPVTRGPLRLNAAGTALISDRAGLAFPIRDGVPVLIAELAQPIEGIDQIVAP